MGTHQRIVDRIWRRILHKTGPIKQKIRQPGGNSCVPVGLARTEPALITKSGERHTGWLYQAVTYRPQAIHREALTILSSHQAAANDIVLGRGEYIFLRRLNNLLGILCIIVGHGSHFIALANLPGFLQETPGWEVVQRRADDIELFVLSLVARTDADARIFHSPDGAQHSHAEFKPVYVLRRSSIDAGNIPGSLQVSRKRSSHRAKDNRRDFATIFGDLVDVRPGLIQAHTDNNKTVRGLGLELRKTRIDGIFIRERFGPDVKLYFELLGGGIQHFRIVTLALADIVGRAGPAHPVVLDVRAYEHNTDNRLAGGSRFGSEQRRGEIEGACFRGHRHSAGARQKSATIQHNGTTGFGRSFIGIHRSCSLKCNMHCCSFTS